MFRSQWLVLMLIFVPAQVFSQTIELYVDKNTKQVFTEPGTGRVKLGTFAPVIDGKVTQPAVPTNPQSSNPLSVQAQTSPAEVASAPIIENPPVTLGDVIPKKEWFDKLSIKGYTQLRYSSLFGRDGADWFHPQDKTVADDTTFLIRRVRLLLSGDVSDHLFVYVQPEFMAASSDGSDSSVQMRDVYGDVALDSKKEYRFRLGQSKVPFGFANMQSSQNRATLERADVVESAAEGQRDIGVFFYWAPEEIRKRYKKINQDGLKGSGDYGVLGLGAYSGEGLNRLDTNNSPHVVAKLSYPFQFSDGQIFEPGVQAYTGRFVPKTKPYTIAGDLSESSPTFRSDGVQDERVGVSAVMYPQPLGFEAEWNVGHGPELSDDFRSIDDKSLQGGYLQANYKLDVFDATFFPFIRWQYFDGGRKFARNSPHQNVNEWDFGLEFSPWKELELTAQYSYTDERTNTNVFPYQPITNGSRLGLQAQINY